MATNQKSSEAEPQTKVLEKTTPINEMLDERHRNQTPAEAEAEAYADAEVRVEEEYDADEKMKRKYRKTKYEQILFWSIVVVFTAGVLLTASLGILVQQDLLQSVIWFAPLVVLTAPIIYARVHFALFSQIVTRFLISLAVMVVMMFVLLATILIGYADEVWAQVVGNETLGSLGLTGTLSILGVLIVLGLTLVLPLIFFGWLFHSLIQEELNLVKVFLLAIITPVTFFFSIGLSIIVNSRW